MAILGKKHPMDVSLATIQFSWNYIGFVDLYDIHMVCLHICKGYFLSA